MSDGTLPLVITVRQPWAWLIVHGGKDAENARGGPGAGGRLLIHADLAVENDGFEVARRLGVEVPTGEIVHGAVIGSVEVTGCVADSRSAWARPRGVALAAR